MNRYTLHCVAEDAYVVVQRNIRGEAITGHAGFTERDLKEAEDTGQEIDLRDWEFIEITPEAAAYVAATYPAVIDQQ